VLPLGSTDPAAASPERRKTMTLHKYAVGQTVDFLPSALDGNVPRGRYKIQRLLPSETKDLQYRVKHVVDGHERVVSQSRLRDSRQVLG
jgi:hypothetical protein